MHVSPSRTNRLLSAVVILVAAIAAMPVHRAAAQETEQKIVVLVNDTPISGYDIAQRMRLTSVTTRAQPSPAMRKKVIEELINEAIQLHEAKKHGIVVGKDDVDRALDSLAQRNNMSREKLLGALGQLGIHDRTIRQRIRAQIAWQRVVRQKFRNQVTIAAADVDKALSGQKQDETGGTGQTEFHLRRVRFDLPENPSQKAIATRLVQAEQLRGRVTTCDQIADALRRFSGTSMKEIGRKKADQIAQPSRALLLAAKTGQLTPANITSSGVELYAVCGRRSVQTNETQRRKVQAQLIGQEYEILALRYLRDLRQEAFVEYR